MTPQQLARYERIQACTEPGYCPEASARTNLLKKLGYETVWYYQNVQSGDVSYSLVDPMNLHWSEREMYYSKEVRIEDVPLWEPIQIGI